MKNNLYIFTSKDPEFGGGVEKVSREIGCRFFKSGNYDVYFVFPGEKSEIKNKNGINYLTVKSTLKIPFFSEFIFNTKLIRLFKKLKGNDLVISNGISLTPYLLFYKKNFKLIHICHGTLYGASCSVKNRGLGYFKKLLNIIYCRCLDVMVKPILKKSNLIVTLSKYLKDELVNHYKINMNKIEVIYNGCDLCNIKLKPHHKGSPLKVAFIGSEYGRKGLNILGGVAREMVNEYINFSVIGTKLYKPESKNIKSLGRLKREEVYKNMAESDVIFLPSHYEGQPLVLLEGMSFGCIPVCSKACHMDMLESTEFNKFISDKNCVEDYVSIFRKILELKNLDNCRKIARDIVSKYSWNNQTKEYMKLFDKL